MRKTKNLMVNISVLIITLIMLFLILEASLRIFYPQLTTARAEEISPQIFEKSDYTPWKLKPNSSDRMISSTGKEYDVPVYINSDGLRDDEITNEEIKTKKIIGVIGDSFTFGYGVRLEDTYHQKLEKMINPKSEELRVINMGRADGSYTTDVQYLYLKEKGLKFRPEIVVIGFYVGNDITDLSKQSIWLSTDANGNPTNITTTYTYIDEKNRYRRNYKNLRAEGAFSKFNQFMSEWSHNYMFFKNLYISLFLTKPEPNHLSKYPNEYSANFATSKRLLDEINKMSRLKGTKLVVMLLPSPTQVDDIAWDGYTEFYGENADRFNPQNEIMDFCSEKNLKCLDLLPYFIGKPELYFRIDGHWNEKGHELTGEKLYEYLIEQGLI